MLEAHTSRRSVLNRVQRGVGVVFLGVFALVAGSEGTQNAQANGDTRTLTLYHTHRGDKTTITFKRDGRYDANGLKQLSYFLRDWRNDKQTRMEPRLFDIVWEVHREVGRGQMINIVSAYRSPETNAYLRAHSRGVAKSSQHMLGRAMDFYITGVPVSAVREAGMRLQRGGVGFYPTSGRPFVHLDAGSIRAWPRMSRTQLARLFPGGKTVHQPAEGGQMPGYQVALAELKSRGEVSIDSAYASSSTGKSRGLFARLFGSDEGDEGETSAPTVVASANTPRAVAARAAAPASSAPAAADEAPEAAVRTVVARVVPMPTPRPADMGRAAPAETVVAALDIPTPPVAPARTVVASAAPAQPAEPDMVWRSGAQPALRGADAAEPGMALASTIPSPRPRPTEPTSAVAVLAAIPTPIPADRTASLGNPRPREIDAQTATAYQAEAATFPRLPEAFLAKKSPAQPEMTLAYASPQASQLPVETRSRSAAPHAQQKLAPSVAMDGVRVISADATPSAIYAAATASKRASLTAEPMVTARLDDGALRAVAAPVRAFRDADDTTLKHPDQSHYGALLAAPAAALANGFGTDPNHGARSDRFAGSSVMLLRTISFAPAASSTASNGQSTRG